MRCCGGDVGVAEAPEHTHSGVFRMNTMQEVAGGVVLSCTTRATVYEEGGRGKRFDPVGVRHGGVGEHGPRDVVERPKNTLGTPVLW